MDAVVLTSTSLALIPVVIALTQIVKTFVVDARYAPIVSIVLGIGFAFLVPALTIPFTVLQGVLIGLSSSGLFSGVKSVVTNA